MSQRHYPPKTRVILTDSKTGAKTETFWPEGVQVRVRIPNKRRQRASQQVDSRDDTAD